MTVMPTHTLRDKRHKVLRRSPGTPLAGRAWPNGSRGPRVRRNIDRRILCRLGWTAEPGRIRALNSCHLHQIPASGPGRVKPGCLHWSVEDRSRIHRRNCSGQSSSVTVVRSPLNPVSKQEQQRSGSLPTTLSYLPPIEKPMVAILYDIYNLKVYFGSKSTTNRSASSNASLNACMASAPIIPFSIEKPSSASKLRCAEYAPLNGTGLAIENLADTFVGEPSSSLRTPEKTSVDSRNSIAIISTLICSFVPGVGFNGLSGVGKLRNFV